MQRNDILQICKEYTLKEKGEEYWKNLKEEEINLFIGLYKLAYNSGIKKMESYVKGTYDSLYI